MKSEDKNGDQYNLVSNGIQPRLQRQNRHSLRLVVFNGIGWLINQKYTRREFQVFHIVDKYYTEDMQAKIYR